MRFHDSRAIALLYGARLGAAKGYADNQVPILKDEPHVAANFPEVDIEVLSPAFLSPETVPADFANGTAAPTDQAILEGFLYNLSERHDWISYHESTDFPSEEGRSLPYVRLCADTACDSTSGKLRIWLQGGVHGNEPGGEQALLAVLGKLDANETWAKSVLEKTEILVLPRYNPDGVAYFQRYLATGYDPNRDHTALQRQQTRHIKTLLSDFNPHIILDAHEYTPTHFLSDSELWIKAQDALFSAAKSPNIHQDIIALSEGLFTDTVFAALESNGMRTGPYFTVPEENDKPILSELNTATEAGENSHGLLQALSFLCETRGIGLGDQHFHRRVASALIVAETLIQLAVDNADLVYSTVEGARKDFTEGIDEIIVEVEARTSDVKMEFINAASGSVVAVPSHFINTTYPDSVLTRPRPEAYIFSRAWSDVVERLRVFGVEVEELSEEYSGTVEALTVETLKLADTRHQGIVGTTVTTSSSTREVQFPKGAYRVSTKQKNAAYAFVTLEPESPTSYVRYNVILVQRHEEYPVYRIP